VTAVIQKSRFLAASLLGITIEKVYTDHASRLRSTEPPGLARDGCVPGWRAPYFPNLPCKQGGFMRLRFAAVALLLSAVAFSQVATDSKKAAEATADATKTAAHKTAKGTEKAADKTSDTTQTAAKKTGHGVKKGVKSIGHGVKKGAKKTGDAVR
jgi:hypothetical protein